MDRDCKRFDEIQLRDLLGESSGAERRWAAAHARSCDNCRDQGQRDRRLEAAIRDGDTETEREFGAAHDRLATSIEERRVYCGRADAPFGSVLLASTVLGLRLVSFRRSENSFLNELEEEDLLPEFAPAKIEREIAELERYFAGRLRRFRLRIDLRAVTPFQRSVLDAAAEVPFGEVVSYGEIARRIGKPSAQRAVGGALGRNPVPIVIPCHRVIASDGSLGGYTGGLRIKRALMGIEGVRLQDNLFD